MGLETDLKKTLKAFQSAIKQAEKGEKVNFDALETILTYVEENLQAVAADYRTKKENYEAHIDGVSSALEAKKQAIKDLDKQEKGYVKAWKALETQFEKNPKLYRAKGEFEFGLIEHEVKVLEVRCKEMEDYCLPIAEIFEKLTHLYGDDVLKGFL